MREEFQVGILPGAPGTFQFQGIAGQGVGIGVSGEIKIEPGTGRAKAKAFFEIGQ